VGFANWFNGGQFDEVLRWSNTIVELAEGDAMKGAGFGIGSPLAVGLAFRSIARWWYGLPGWRQDLDDAVEIGHAGDASTLALTAAWGYGVGIVYGVLPADDTAVSAAEKAVCGCQSATNDYALRGVQFSLGCMLLHRDAEDDRRRGLTLMEEARDVFLPERAPSLVPVAAVHAARESAMVRDADAAIARMRDAVDELYRARRHGWVVCCAGAFVETLLTRGTDGDLAEAQYEIDRLTALRPGQRWVARDLTLLRLRALAARRSSDTEFRIAVQRYRATAESFGYAGHVAWADALMA
jgi:hypothetical protein